ncbi:MAG: hypothetical protein ACEPOV_06930 [Hyphomicrobiales bacterium]
MTKLRQEDDPSLGGRWSIINGRIEIHQGEDSKISGGRFFAIKGKDFTRRRKGKNWQKKKDHLTRMEMVSIISYKICAFSY